ncbi:hypothetical protein ACGK9U_12875 [Mariniflexile sp. HNIBRBA6329]|uniref:hypothetical protein n=1 Tax=Mariniflexile sp. HNIBRBA6329 TaxID=3373088 RepID=UPI0037470B89
MSILFLAMGCSNDDNSVSSTDDLLITDDFLIGDWFVTNVSVQGKVSALEKNSEYWGWVFYPYPIPVTSSKFETENYAVNFSNSPKQLTSIGRLKTTYVLNVHDYLNNDVISKVIEDVDFLKQGNWHLNNTTIMVNNSDQNENYYIKKVSDSEIMLLKLLKDGITLNSFDGEVKCEADLDMWVTLQKK